MGLLYKIQQEQAIWAEHNFPKEPTDGKSRGALLGVMEEIGELKEAAPDGDDSLAVLMGRLAHAHLKRSQGIRRVSRIDQVDAVADIMIFLIDYCNQEEIDIEYALFETWSRVRQRDFIANPVNGVVVKEEVA